MDLQTLGAEPVSKDSPAGINAVYEPEYQELEAEINKLSKPSEDASVAFSWLKVRDLAVSILKEKSKDLLAASYLSLALTHIDRYDGLAVGIRVYRDLLEIFWDNLYPAKKRKKGRINTISWWLDKTAEALDRITEKDLSEEKKSEAVSRETFESIQQDLNKIEALLQKYLGEDAPSILYLQRRVVKIPVVEPPPQEAPEPPKAELPTESEAKREIVNESEPGGKKEPDRKKKSGPKKESGQKKEPARKKDSAQKPEPADTSSPKQKETETTPPLSGEPPKPMTDQESPPPSSVTGDQEKSQTALRTAVSQLQQAATEIRESDPTDPIAYRFARIASWSALNAPPPSENGKTRLPPPAKHTRQYISGLPAKQEWTNLLQSAEQNLSGNIFWLDLNRFSAESLAHLGKKHKSAEEAVCLETAILLHRIPELEKLTFSDGTPMADPETRKWLHMIRLGTGGADSAPSSSTIDDAQTAETVESARNLEKKKQPADALETLQRGLRKSASGKESFHLLLEIGRILSGTGRTDLVIPILEQISEEITKYRLEEWDPDTALRGLRMIRAGFEAHTDEASQTKATNALNRITRLDPAWAFRSGR